jgi:hypothetical protein
MGLSGYVRHALRRINRVAIFVLSLDSILMPADFSRAADGEALAATLSTVAPRQAVLVCYCPNLRRLSDTWDLFAPLRDSNDTLLGQASGRLGQLDKKFLRVWTERLGCTMSDLAGALPGEVLMGWMPRISASGAAFEPHGWVLVARRLPGRDEAIQGLWQRVVSRMAKGGRIERRQIGGVAVEEVVWENDSPAELTVQGRSKKKIGSPTYSALPGERKSVSFDEIRTVERRAVSLGLSEQFVFFSPSGAERLEPWIRAALERRGAAGQTDGFQALIREANRTGELVLAIQTTPPAWVPSVETEAERWLGARPDRVLLSQIRLLNAAISRRGDRIVLDAQATVLPPPGWIAQLLGAFAEGAAFSAADDAVGELSARADFGRLWTTLHAIVAEGWPAVGLALDLFLAPLGGERGEGAAQLAATVGGEAAMFAFRPTRTEDIGRSWAIALPLRDRERFALLEPRLEQLLQTFAFAPAHYDVAADGRLRARAQATATTFSTMIPRLHIAQWDSRFVVAGSQTALEKAIHAVSGKTMADGVSTRSRALSEPVSDSGPRRPAMVFYNEMLENSLGGVPLGGRTRRTIRTPEGTIELDSPPPEPGMSTRQSLPPATQPTTVASTPIARLVGAFIVESENSVRLRIAVEPLGSRSGEVKRPPSAGRKEPNIQE